MQKEMKVSEETPVLQEDLVYLVLQGSEVLKVTKVLKENLVTEESLVRNLKVSIKHLSVTKM